MQDTLAIAVALAAAVWLGRTLWRQFSRPACGPPPGSDGFVPLDALHQPAPQKPGRPGGRPDR